MARTTPRHTPVPSGFLFDAVDEGAAPVQFACASSANNDPVLPPAAEPLLESSPEQSAARRMFESLPETQRGSAGDLASAVARVAAPLRESLQAFSLRLFQAEFLSLSEAFLRDSTLHGSRAHTPLALATSANLSALSVCTHIASLPWHIASGATLVEAAALLQRASVHDRGAHALAQLQGALTPRASSRADEVVNLFVRAGENDDRDSYLRRVLAEIRKRHGRVHSVVFDEDVMDWRPEPDFLKACATIGIAPLYIGIAKAHRAGTHSLLNPKLHQMKLRSVFVGESGREMRLDANGGVIEESAVSTPAPVASAQAKVEAPKESFVPSNAMRDRIQALRHRQARPQ